MKNIHINVGTIWLFDHVVVGEPFIHHWSTITEKTVIRNKNEAVAGDVVVLEQPLGLFSDYANTVM